MEQDLKARLVIHQVPTTQSRTLLRLAGKLNTHTTAQLFEIALQMARRPHDHRRLLLDLSAVTHCDNGSLFTLLGLCQALDIAGISTAISKTNHVVQTRITQTGLAHRLPRQAQSDTAIT
ncbi:hypothetical protein GCM10010358_73260 [Streptomyces minutiscleroticus]|uniref:STAS domain-containing protein n=2 Tax=Streptomyces minutiscleroticus TaxID=68238 RepID=A0A918P004_9ACTN|nr:hypothetical protein GCM10010358_73260 [Streptomyces minutiscleroticus]